MQRLIRCWWCGHLATVDSELTHSGGMVKDSDTSWLCEDNAACGARVNERVRITGRRTHGWLGGGRLGWYRVGHRPPDDGYEAYLRTQDDLRAGGAPDDGNADDGAAG